MGATQEAVATQSNDGGTAETPLVPDKELDAREGDGVLVQLWHRPDTQPPQLYVTVRDHKLGVDFEAIEVPSPDKAYHVFHHAMAYLSESATQAAMQMAATDSDGA